MQGNEIVNDLISTSPLLSTQRDATQVWLSHRNSSTVQLPPMPTYYRPTKWRGKRVVEASIDPAERRRHSAIGWVAIIFVLGFGLIAWLISQ
jgi:hypothetical protein